MIRSLLILALFIPLQSFAEDSKAPACPKVDNKKELMKWRSHWALKLGELKENTYWKNDHPEIHSEIKKCFPNEQPKCVSRISRFSGRKVVKDTVLSDPLKDPARQPPKEMWINGKPGKFRAPHNIEEIAEKRGWPYSRYKTRISGGFDSTHGLLMVYVPGKTLNPPQNYDQWINFAVPNAEGETRDAVPWPRNSLPSDKQYHKEKKRRLVEQETEDSTDSESGNESESSDQSNGDQQNTGSGSNDSASETSAAETTSVDAPEPVYEDYIERIYPNTFTIVTTVKKPNKPSHIMYTMFDRESGTNEWTPVSRSTNCGTSCHPNGLRAISPLGYHVKQGEPQLPEKFWKNVREINDSMDESQNEKMSDWLDEAGNKQYKPEDHWPMVGSSDPLNQYTRTKEFIMGGKIGNREVEGCAPDKKDVNWENVAEAMSCENCHDNYQRGSINETASEHEVRFKIVTDQSMPVGYHFNPLEQGNAKAPVEDSLNPNERKALADCLYEEFEIEKKLTTQWLEEVSCQ